MEKGINDTDEQTIKNTLKSINSKIIPDKDGNGFYRVFCDENVEKVNPVEFYKLYELQKRAIIYRDLLIMKTPFAARLSDDFFIRFAKEELSKENFWEIKEQIEIHDNFLKLLETTRKKDQESLLRGMSINPDQLISLIFKSYNIYGYLYSRYRFENFPKGFESNIIPKIANIEEDGAIKIIGETDLSEGQVKNILEQRKVIISHFFDKDNEWHCFFTTYNSIGGKENWKDGQPHFHYISSAFGITRDKFIESMESGQYKSTSIHIDLLGNNGD